MRVAGVFDPVAPSPAIDDGWFRFIIQVTNPRSTPVIVSLTPTADAGPPLSFSWIATCLSAIQSCGGIEENEHNERAYDEASVNRFASGETKRFVVDLQVGRTGDVYWALPMGAYAFRGYYNVGPASAPDTVILGP